MSPDPSLAEAAVAYAQAGTRVLPVSGIHVVDGETVCECGRVDCASPGKHPLILDWRRAASADAGTVERWWTKWPNANVALLCGEAFDVLDIDGHDALDALVGATRTAALSVLRAELPLVQSGARAGHLHMYFEPLGINRSALVSDHVQVLSTGRYVIAPPSQHRSGLRYELVNHTTPVGPTPRWLADLLAEPPSKPPLTPDGRVDGLESFFEPEIVRDPRRYAIGALTHAAERVAAAPEGTRNNVLNSETYAIAKMVLNGDLQLADLVRELSQAATSAGLPEAEIEATIESAVRAAYGGTTGGSA